MKTKIFSFFIFLLLPANFASAEDRTPVYLTAIQEAYQAAQDNLVSGSGMGSYEIYVAPSGIGTKLELKVKAKAKLSFDHGKFYIRLDYEKDDIHHLESRIIVYDGTAVLANRMSKYIIPAHSEADVYEGEPILPIMRKACFDYNPCQLPATILHVDWLSNPKHATNVIITQDQNMDYSGSYLFTGAPHHLRGSFIASHHAGYNINDFRLLLIDSDNFEYEKCHATWDRKENVWYVKSIDTQWSQSDGSSERTIFQYTSFEPNAKISSSLFTFDALSLPPTARLLDRRRNAEEPVIHQSRPSKAVESELNTLADKVKSLAPPSPPPQFRRLRPMWRKYLLLVAAVLVCITGLLLLWKRRRQRHTRSQT